VTIGPKLEFIPRNLFSKWEGKVDVQVKARWVLGLEGLTYLANFQIGNQAQGLTQNNYLKV
jgi:hypothetical protein